MFNIRNDVEILGNGPFAVDRNDPAAASSAIELSLPEGFSSKAWAAWEYFDGSAPAGTAFLFIYKNQLVVTDESLYLTEHGNGTAEAPLGFPRFVGDSWEELESWLEAVYDEIKEQGWL